MRIKHWQGYGTVNAVRKKTVENGEDKIMTILVSGNHEYGLNRNDKYDVFNWLLRKFDKTVSDYRCIRNVNTEEGWDNTNHCDTCLYTIEYKAS